MRNFKKFLALVLAMLMVSACAVSVSAYSDQDAIDATGYAEAVEVLGMLGVMQGPGDDTFNPNGTLTRAEAAVITAKLVAGAKGQSYDWTESTCMFADVTAEWSFGYINYVAERYIMRGDGSGKFNPNGTLQVDEALALAVKALSPETADKVAEKTEKQKPDYWATYWIDAAEDLGLAPDDIFKYTGPCSRAMMAQIGYNMLTADLGKDDKGNQIENRISAGFGMTTIKEAEITSATSTTVAIEYPVKDAEGKVTATQKATINAEAFAVALKAAGVEASASELKNYKLTLTYSTKTNTIYGVSIDSTLTAYTYADGKIANVKKDNANTGDITIDGVTYKVAKSSTSATDNTTIGDITTTNGIAVYVDGVKWTEAEAKNSIPTYYKADACDDNADGVYDRLVIDTYEIATVKFEKNNSKGVAIYKVNGTTIGSGDDNAKPITWTGVAFEADDAKGDKPMLVSTKKDLNDAGDAYVIDVLELAEIVTGKLTAISKTNKTVTIDGTVYGFAAGCTTNDTWTLGQTVSLYTIGKQFVKFTGTSTAYQTVIVDSVVVKDGKAVVTGFDVGNGYNKVELVVDGVVENGKLISKTAYDTVTNPEKAGIIALGAKKNDGTYDMSVKFDEGGFYKFQKTTDGIYVTNEGITNKTAAKTLANPLTLKGVPFNDGKNDAGLKVSGAYIYKVKGTTETASYKSNNTIILELVGAQETDLAKNAYANTYNRYEKDYANKSNVKAVLVDNTPDDNVKNYDFIYVSESTASDIDITTIGQDVTLVQIMDGNEIEIALDYNTYNAVDLLTGAKVVVKSSIGAEKGHYYTVKDNTLVEDTTDLWVREQTVKVEYAKDSIVGDVKANTTKLVVIAETGKKKAEDAESTPKTFGIDKITIYSADKNGVIREKDGKAVTLKIEDVLTSTTNTTFSKKFMSYIVADKMVLVCINDEIKAAEDQLIQVTGKVDEKDNTFKAVDVLTGEVIDEIEVKMVETDETDENGEKIKEPVIKVVVGQYYAVVDGKIAKTAEPWISNQSKQLITVKTTPVEGTETTKVESVSAKPVKLVVANGADAVRVDTPTVAKEAVTYAPDAVTVYKANKEGIITTTEGAADTADVNTLKTGTYCSYVVEGKVIVVVPATPAE